MQPTPLPVTPEMVQLAYWLGGLIAVLSVAVMATTIWANLRRRPPIDKEFATKSEVIALEARIISQIGTLADERQRSAAVLHRKLDDQTTASAARIEAQAVATASKFDQVVNTMQVGFLDVQRAIGRLEGKIAAITNGNGRSHE